MTSAHHTFGKRKAPHTIIIARGEKVRHFTVSPRTVGVTTTIASLLVVGCLSTAGYLFLRDDFRASGIVNQIKLQQSYEERIASLRSQLDRAVSRQMLDKQVVESKVDVLIDQQVELSARYDKLQPLLDRARANGLMPTPVPVPLPKPTGDDTAALRSSSETKPIAFSPDVAPPALDRFSLVDLSGGVASQWLRRGDPSAAKSAGSAPIPHSLIQDIGESIDHVEDGQIANLASLAEQARAKAGNIALALRSEGIAVPVAVADLAEEDTAPTGGEGGPFVAAPENNLFDVNFEELDRALTELQLLRQKTMQLPLAAPVDSTLVSSRFGVRADPFLGSSALHTGIDFVATSGSAVGATADGMVIQAGYNGGYGNMVEVDHGGGVVTRYGHLSSIAVGVGEKVRTGEIVGRVGSTGRSTGPHLHYEVRRDGGPIDPSRFLRAGRKISAQS